MFVLKNRNYPKLSEVIELPCKSLPFKTFAERILGLANDDNNIFFTGEKIFTMTTQTNSQNDQLYTYNHQP